MGSDMTEHWRALHRLCLNNALQETFATATPEARAWAAARVKASAAAGHRMGVDPDADIEGERLFPEVQCIGKLLLHAQLGKDVTDPSKDMEPLSETPAAIALRDTSVSWEDMVLPSWDWGHIELQSEVSSPGPCQCPEHTRRREDSEKQETWKCCRY